MSRHADYADIFFHMLILARYAYILRYAFALRCYDIAMLIIIFADAIMRHFRHAVFAAILMNRIARRYFCHTRDYCRRKRVQECKRVFFTPWCCTSATPVRHFAAPPPFTFDALMLFQMPTLCLLFHHFRFIAIIIACFQMILFFMRH